MVQVSSPIMIDPKKTILSCNIQRFYKVLK